MGHDPKGSHYGSHIKGDEVCEYSLLAMTTNASRGELYIQEA